MKFPYGICDFYKIITEGYFYIDRTNQIPQIEAAGDQLLFLRPRRFGKSLLLPILRNYYDLAKAAEFERLFGRLAIGQAPTPRHNQYFILKWDFSAVDPQGETDEIQRSLHDHINGCIEQFKAHYRDYLEYEIELDKNNALRSFQAVLAATARTPYKLYLLIDEYDNFANEVMMSRRRGSQERYESLLYGEGALKTVFKVVKSASEGQGLDRVFITGVSPIVMSDITSGYNIAEDIYLRPEFNDLCGFHETEVAGIVKQVVEKCQLPPEKETEAVEMMRTFYNGYCFTPRRPAGQGLLYNPTLVLYFVKQLHLDCDYPRRILDSNLATDQDKIAYVSRLPGGKEVVMRALDETAPLAIGQLSNRFGVRVMLYPEKDTAFMASLLYYLGVLTFNGQTPMGELILEIPNLVVRELYIERIRKMLLPDLDKNEMVEAAKTLYSAGDIEPVCQLLESRHLKVFDNRDYRWANALTIKTAFLMLLFNDTFYIVDSEPALERSYADLTLIVRPDMRRYTLLDLLIEFKFLPLKETGLSGDAVRGMSREALHTLAPVQKKFAEAQPKLAGYRRALETAYGERLRLRTYTVVALGFERLVWLELPSAAE